MAAVLTAVVWQYAAAQETPGREAKGMPPRATPGDYQAHAQAGAITVAAEFTGHSVATPEAVFSTEDYVAVEVGLFGPPEARANLSYENFALRVNGKKTPSPAQAYELVFKSLKDPAFEQPSSGSKGGKTTIGGSGNQNDPPPAPVHMPIGMERAMEQKVQKAALPEGDRPLPEAGLLFFEHRGKVNGIHSIELIYTGPDGKKAVLNLQP